MIVDPDFMDHWRTGMVADAIQDPMAPVYILRLWAHCQERRSDTFVMPTRGLKAQCKTPCDAEVFERALIDAGFIERNGDTVTVCGWAEKNAALLAAWENGSKGGRPRKQKTETKPTGNPQETQAEPNENQNETHAEPIREEKRREEKKSAPAARGPVWVPPDWMPPSQWAAFVAMRKAKGKRAPFTDEARDGIVAHLSKFHAAGHDLAAILQESVNNGWSGVFAPRAAPPKPKGELSELFARGAA